MVRANEDGSSAAAAIVVVGPPAVGGQLPHLHVLLDDGQGASGSASSAGEGTR